MKKMRKMMAALTAAILLIMSFPAGAYAAVKTIPDSSVTAQDTQRLKLGFDNMTATWNGVDGIIDTTVVGNSGAKAVIYVPVKSTTSTWSHNDFLDLTFSNAGAIAGRSIDVIIHFVEYKEVPATTSFNAGRMQTMIALLFSNSLNVGKTGGFIESDVNYADAKEVELKVSIVWSDTKKPVEMPFFMAVADLDGIGRYVEAFEPLEGFGSDFFTYKNTSILQSGNKFAGSKDTNTYVDNTMYATMTENIFRFRFYNNMIALTGINIYNQYALLENPAKAVQ